MEERCTCHLHVLVPVQDCLDRPPQVIGWHSYGTVDKDTVTAHITTQCTCQQHYPLCLVTSVIYKRSNQHTWLIDLLQQLTHGMCAANRDRCKAHHNRYIGHQANIATLRKESHLRVSLPPKPPPMRLVLDTSLCMGTPSVLATYTCTVTDHSASPTHLRTPCHSCALWCPGHACQ